MKEPSTYSNDYYKGYSDGYVSGEANGAKMEWKMGIPPKEGIYFIKEPYKSFRIAMYDAYYDQFNCIGENIRVMNNCRWAGPIKQPEDFE